MVPDQNCHSVVRDQHRAPASGSLHEYSGKVVFSDHFPDAETDGGWFPFPEAPADDADDGRQEDEHLDPLRAAYLDLVLQSNPSPPLRMATAEPDNKETFAVITRVDNAPGRNGVLWIVLWLDDDHELTVLEYGDSRDALADFDRHLHIRAGDPDREPYNAVST